MGVGRKGWMGQPCGGNPSGQGGGAGCAGAQLRGKEGNLLLSKLFPVLTEEISLSWATSNRSVMTDKDYIIINN